MAMWDIHYRTADGVMTRCARNPSRAPRAGEAVFTSPDYPSGNPWMNGKMWDQSTQTLVDRPPVVLRSRIGYDIQNNPHAWPEIDEYNAAVDAISAAPRRARIRTAVRAMMRRFLGDGRWRADGEAGELEPDTGGED